MKLSIEYESIEKEEIQLYLRLSLLLSPGSAR